MDDDQLIEVQQVLESIREADVISILFTMFRRSLVADLRPAQGDAPFVRIAAQSRGPEDRLRYIRRQRPSLPRPTNVTMFPWPRSVGSFESLGIYDALLRRTRESAHPPLEDECVHALRDLYRLERREMVAAIRGENYYTVWSARA